MPEPSRRLTLRDLPFVARLTLALFLCSVGLGYLAALVQLHAQQAAAGKYLPDQQEVIDAYHGKRGMGTLERLITAPEYLPFSASGTMRTAFTTHSLDWNPQVFEDRAVDDFIGNLKDLPEEERAKKEKEKQEEWDALPQSKKDAKIKEAEEQIRQEREDEAAVLVDWIHHDLDKDAYEKNKYPMPADLRGKPITKKFLKDEADGSQTVAIRSILGTRCVRCHSAGREADFAPLNSWKQLAYYSKKDAGQGGMPLRKLAQTTHVHLLGFSMLYMLTGFIFAMSGWPAIFRFFIAPLALLAQVVDISFWWLARMPDPYGTEFAKCIIYSGGVAGAALGLQIILSLFSLFGWFGRLIVLLLLLLALGGAYYLNDQVIAPYLASEAKLAP